MVFAPIKPAPSPEASGTCQVLPSHRRWVLSRPVYRFDGAAPHFDPWWVSHNLVPAPGGEGWRIRRNMENATKSSKNLKDPPKQSKTWYVMLGYLGWFYTQSGCCTGPKSLTLSQAMLWTLTPLLSSDAAKDSRETPAVSRPLVPAAKKNVMRFEWFDQIFCRWNSDDFFVEPW